MDSRRSAQAFLLVGVLIMGGCGTAQDATGSTPASNLPGTPSSVVATAAPRPSESASPSAQPSPTQAAPRTVDVSIPVDFSITVPGDWERDPAITSTTTYVFRAGLDGWVMFTELGPDNVQDWVQQVSLNPGLSASEPEVIDLNGAPGVRVDLELNEGEDEVLLLREGWGEWTVSRGRPNRLWIVEVGGVVVVILTDAPERAFDDWVSTVGDALTTIEWSR